jgi:hypothetical protein
MDDRWNRWAAWVHSFLTTLLILGLFYDWFVRADRYIIFLYHHSGATLSAPTTMSRYWMSGLVAAGVVMVCSTLVNWFAGRVFGLYYRTYRAPAWWQVWWRCVPFVSVGIPVITMTLGQPPLSPETAILCVGSALAGVFFALPLSSLAANQPAELGWSLMYGAGLMPPLLLLRLVELSDARYANEATGLALGSIVAGGGWLVLVTLLRVRHHLPPLGFGRLLVSGLCCSYVLLPLAHYLILTPPRYRYISVAANFFALTPGMQLLSFGLAVLFALGTLYFQRKLSQPARNEHL